MIYDCFMFFNELDLLELRLKYLDDSVDFFVISESDLTQAGDKKPLYYEENKDRFKKWHNKIIHNVVKNIPNPFVFESYKSEYHKKVIDIMKNYTHYPHNVWRYENESYQREMSISCIIDRLEDTDILMVSDLDEIPNKEKIQFNKLPDDIFIHCIQSAHQYYVNVTKDERWFGTKIFKWKYFKNNTIGLNGIRMNQQLGEQLEPCGWHFSFLGGVEKIKEKIKAYGHQEFNTVSILNNIGQKIKNNDDIFNRGYTYKEIPLNYFPNEMEKILSEYVGFIK